MFYYEGIDNTVLTFYLESSGEEGDVCRLIDTGVMDQCAAGEPFHGVIQHVRDTVASVIIRGMVRVPYTGTAPAVGLVKLVADGAGGVKVDATNGREYLVVNVDSETSYMDLFL